jgi:hypothetical protein
MFDFKIGQEVYIPPECPLTNLNYGLKKKPEKMRFLGTTQRIRMIDGNRITISSGWYFHKDDLIGETPAPPKAEIQLFDPQNLMV